jgi:hypothetical protein
MARHHRIFILMLTLLAFPALIVAQAPPAKETPQTKPKADKNARPKRERADPLAGERRTTAITLVTSLAEEARGFKDERLRARVQMRAAEALWATDADQARALFRRAWEAADSADKEALRQFEDKRRAETEKGGAWAGTNPPNLRAEVLRLAARRDRVLGEEFLAKLSEAAEQEVQTTRVSSDTSPAVNSPVQPTADPEKPSAVVAQRLRLARQFLEEGDTERSLQFADKALDVVSTRGINFLSLLREKDQAAADSRFSTMLQRAVLDPSSDAVIVSVLSSYVFTPFLTVVARGNGQNHTSQERDKIIAPNISPELRAGFLRAAAQILLRPIPPPDQDRTLAGRGGLYFTIARLLPLFEQYAPDFSTDLRARMAVLAADAPESFRNGKSSMLTRGLMPEGTQQDEGQEALERAERAATSAERDQFYARAALEAAHKGDTKAREILESIQDMETRKNARAYVDFSLVNKAIGKKDATEALRLARTGELTHIHRAWALMEIAGIMVKTDAKAAAEILEEAATEARRMGTLDPDRARALFGVATRMYEIDRSRVWDSLSEAVKASNSSTGFTGEDAQIIARFVIGRGASTSNFTIDSFDVQGIFSQLAKDDLFRTIEMAKNFTSEAPRAAATLAIVRSVLDQKPRGQSVGSSQNVVTND